MYMYIDMYIPVYIFMYIYIYHQLRIVANTTTNDEGQGNDVMRVQGERADTLEAPPSPVDPVDKVVCEPMEALNQLDGAAGDLAWRKTPPTSPSPLFSQRYCLSQFFSIALFPFDSPTLNIL